MLDLRFGIPVQLHRLATPRLADIGFALRADASTVDLEVGQVALRLRTWSRMLVQYNIVPPA